MYLHNITTNLPVKPLLMGVALLGLAACQSTFGAKKPDTGVGYQQARFAEVSAMNNFRSCRDQALAMDAQARSNASTAQYLASANLLSKCEGEVGPEIAHLGKNERIHAYALSVVNYVKGGDVATAATNLNNFKQAFPNQDLYFADGSSFIETFEVLTGQHNGEPIGMLSALNISRDLKREMNRKQHWFKS